MGAPAKAASLRRLGRSSGNTRQRVILKLQYVSDREGKLLLAAKWAALLVALGVMLWGFTTKMREDANFLLKGKDLELITVPLASVCVAACLATLLLLVVRLAWCRSTGKRWTPRQRLVVGFTALSLFLQLCNSTFWLASMAYTLATTCGWFNTVPDVMGSLQWTIINLIFTLNIIQAAQLLPTGAWEALLLALHLRLPCCGAGAKPRVQDSPPDGAKRGKGEHPGSDDNTSNGAAEQGRAAEAEEGGVLGGIKTAFAAPTTMFAGTAVEVAAGVKEAWAHWGVRICALAFLFVPTQVVISLILKNVLDDDVQETIASHGFTCDPYDEATGQVYWECFPKGDFRCQDIANPACWPPCQEWDWSCMPDARTEGLTWALGSLLNLASLVFLFTMWLALHQLGKRPYCEYRVQNLAARLALRTRVPTQIIFMVNMVFSWYIRLGTCTSYMLTWPGAPAVQVMLTAQCVVEMLMFMPSAQPDERSMLLHDSLQQFAWTEAEAGPMLEERGLEEEPLFCFQTALKAAYYSLHVYRHFNPKSTVTSLSNAMALSGCSHSEWLREPTHDSNCLLMWGHTSLVISFRGTASVKNIKADLKAWRTAHKPRRGSLLAGTMPLVHLGFMQSWECDGFNQKVLARIREILEGKAHADMAPAGCTVDGCCGHCNEAAKAAAMGAAAGDAASSAAASAGKSTAQGAAEAAAGAAAAAAAGAADVEEGRGSSVAADLANQTTPFRILLAGHSLGGAMTHLCGIDLARSLAGWGFQQAPAFLPLSEQAQQSGQPAVSISTYTFGAPRTGNRAFAADYKEAVPDCWSVINGQDAVAQQAKFVVLFKRPGKAVLLSRRGDLIVRPSTIEQSSHRTSGTSLKQHMLHGSYCPSLASVLRAQVSGKPLPGGQEALEHLCADEAMAQVLEHMLGLAPDGSWATGAAGMGRSPSSATLGRQVSSVG